jgi:hypothetical protein
MLMTDAASAPEAASAAASTASGSAAPKRCSPPEAAPIPASAAGAVTLSDVDFKSKLRGIVNGIKEKIVHKENLRGLKRECIRAAVVGRKPGKVDYLACRSDKPSSGKDQRALSSEPCVTEAYVDYVHWTVNRVFKCLQSQKHPLDPQVFFKKVNRESTFRAFIDEDVGKGLMQMTTAAMKEMTEPDPGYQYLMDLIHARKEACAGLEPIAKAPLQLEGGKKSKVSSKATACQTVSIGDGVARNLLRGVGLFLYYRDGRTGSTSSLLKQFKDHPDFNRMRDYLALVAFNGGPGVQRAVFDKISKKIGKKTSFAKFKQLVDDQSAYTKAMDESADPLFETGVVPDCTEPI